MIQNQTIIGLHLPLHVELGQRRLRGILDYADEHPTVTLADFCFTQDTPVPPGIPLWTGKVDGVVMGVSRSPVTERADDCHIQFRPRPRFAAIQISGGGVQ